MRFLGHLDICCFQALIGLINLLTCFYEKANMEILGIGEWLPVFAAQATKNKGKALLIAQDSKIFAHLSKNLEIKVGFKEAACGLEIINAEVEMVKSHENPPIMGGPSR
jgi:hypothetical protein